jgi:hypothetical protein
MKDYDEKEIIAKGIFYNKKTKLCIFECSQNDIEWYNVHIDDVKGKFYIGCHAKLYKHDTGIIKAIIEKSS